MFSDIRQYYQASNYARNVTWKSRLFRVLKIVEIDYGSVQDAQHSSVSVKKLLGAIEGKNVPIYTLDNGLEKRQQSLAVKHQTPPGTISQPGLFEVVQRQQAHNSQSLVANCAISTREN